MLFITNILYKPFYAFYHMSGWGFTDSAKIYRNGQICGSCYNFTPLTADTIVFNVSGGMSIVSANSSAKRAEAGRYWVQ